jgi:cysteine desulfurase
MQVPGEIARGAVRVSVGAGNTTAQVDDFLSVLSATVKQLQGMTALAS